MGHTNGDMDQILGPKASLSYELCLYVLEFRQKEFQDELGLSFSVDILFIIIIEHNE